MTAFNYAAALIPWTGPGDRFVREGYRDVLSLQQRMQNAAALGVLDGIELMYPGEVNEDNIDEVKRLLDEHGLRLSIIGTPISGARQFGRGTLTARDSATQRAAIERVKAGLDVCAALGGDQIMFFLGQDGCDYSLEVDYQQAWQQMTESIREIAAHRSDVRICLEYKPFEPRRHIFLNDVGTALHLVQRIDMDHVGIVLDTGHTFMAGEVLGESIWLLHDAGRLFHVHFNDNYRGWDDDMVVGSVHFMPFLEAIYWLRRVHYDGWISLDLFPYREDPGTAVAESINFLKYLNDLVDEIGMASLTELLAMNDGAYTQRIVNQYLFGSKS